MAVCVRCGISGPFVKVNEEGLCPLCQCRPNREDPKKSAAKIRFSDPEEILRRYLTTSHTTYPRGYNVVEYYTAEFDCILNALREAPVIPSPRSALLGEEEVSCVFCKDLKGLSLAQCGDFVALDTETSGLSARAQIVEVSAVKFRDFRPTEVFTTLCKPFGGISPGATAIHGITNDDVKHAPRCAQILNGLEEFIGDLPLVAHNAPFDLRVLGTEGMVTRGRRVFDTLPLARALLRLPDGEKLPHYKLADSCRACAILFSGAHRSTADALAAGMLFSELVKRHFGIQNLLEKENID